MIPKENLPKENLQQENLQQDNLPSCFNCTNCIAIGKGDHICIMKNDPILILDEYYPTDVFFACNGKHFSNI